VIYAEFWTFICRECWAEFVAHPAENAMCPKCGNPHILCPACWSVHLVSAAEESHYLEQLEAQLR
jgi:Zn finger protein HypA/HybF involved in hydrogenase expression